MENYLVLNGQKIELTPEQYKEVCNAVSPKKSPFEKKEGDDIYHYINDLGIVKSTEDNNRKVSFWRHEVANYCADMKLMKKRAEYETFERVLWRFSEENGGAGVYSICYDKQRRDWGTATRTANILLPGPTFYCKTVALRAIEVAKGWLSENDLAPEDVFF